MSPRGISDLEHGVNRAPRALTLRQLSEALGLSDGQLAEFEAAARAARAPAQAPAGAGTPSEVRTFLIADIRGYSRFTVAEGDAAAARLTADFASIADDAVSDYNGTLLEVRGDEVMAVFASPGSHGRGRIAGADPSGQ